MKKQVSLLTLTAALLLGACSTYEEVPATSGDGATAVGFLADIAPREQSRADINVDFETGLTGTWNSEDKLGVLANDFSKLLQFTSPQTARLLQARSSAPQALGRTAPSTPTTETQLFPARP